MILDTPEGIEKQITVLQREIEITRGPVEALVQSNTDIFRGDPRDQTLFYYLIRDYNLARSCVVLAKADLSDALAMSIRGLFEDLVWMRWAVKSEQNALAIIYGGENELYRMLRIQLEKGTARITHKNTGEDKTQDLLKNPKLQNLPKRGSVDSHAKEVGLEVAYDILYRSLSMPSHGNTFGIPTTPIVVLLSTATGLLKSINLVVKTWISPLSPDKEVPNDTILKIFNLS